jgi:large subunit ribosomal protein L23Ae
MSKKSKQQAASKEPSKTATTAAKDTKQPAPAKETKQPAKDTKPAAKSEPKKKKKESKLKGGAKTKAAIKAKALAVQKSIKKGTHSSKHKKVRHSVHFRRPKTKELARKPKYPRRSFPRKNPLTQYSILKHPLATESAMQQIENNSTLVFIVDQRANKKQIRDAVSKMYEIQAAKVNTLIRPDGQKKAYVRLTPDYDALEIANKIGII